MKNFYSYIIILFAFVLLNGATTTTEGTKVKPVGGCATTTSSKKASVELVCIPEEKRTTFQKNWCKFYEKNWPGKLCKMNIDCLRVKSNRTEEENKRLEAENQKQAVCAHFSYKHRAQSNTFLLQEPKEGSLQVVKIKKGDEISFMQRVEDNQGWMLVANKDCDQGYINEKFIRRKDDIASPEDKTPDLGNEIIIITSPRWTEKNKLIKVSSAGFFDIEGAVSKSVDQVTLNDEDLIIENNRTFSETLLIKDEDLDIRIIAYKNGEQIGKITFIVKKKN